MIHGDDDVTNQRQRLGDPGAGGASSPDDDANKQHLQQQPPPLAPDARPESPDRRLDPEQSDDAYDAYKSPAPDGGLTAWLALLSSWCMLFCTFGMINCTWQHSTLFLKTRRENKGETMKVDRVLLKSKKKVLALFRATTKKSICGSTRPASCPGFRRCKSSSPTLRYAPLRPTPLPLFCLLVKKKIPRS